MVSFLHKCLSMCGSAVRLSSLSSGWQPHKVRHLCLSCSQLCPQDLEECLAYGRSYYMFVGWINEWIDTILVSLSCQGYHVVHDCRCYTVDRAGWDSVQPFLIDGPLSILAYHRQQCSRGHCAHITCACVSLKWTPRSSIVGSQGTHGFNFNDPFQTILSKIYHKHFHQQCMKVPASIHTLDDTWCYHTF